VREGNPPQINIVHVDGNRSVLMRCSRTARWSTLDIICGHQGEGGTAQSVVAEGLKISLIGDQSVFVNAAVSGVIHEGIMRRR